MIQGQEAPAAVPPEQVAPVAEQHRPAHRVGRMHGENAPAQQAVCLRFRRGMARDRRRHRGDDAAAGQDTIQEIHLVAADEQPYVGDAEAVGGRRRNHGAVEQMGHAMQQGALLQRRAGEGGPPVQPVAERGAAGGIGADQQGRHDGPAGCGHAAQQAFQAVLAFRPAIVVPQPQGPGAARQRQQHAEGETARAAHVAQRAMVLGAACGGHLRHKGVGAVVDHQDAIHSHALGRDGGQQPLQLGRPVARDDDRPYPCVRLLPPCGSGRACHFCVVHNVMKVLLRARKFQILRNQISLD